MSDISDKLTSMRGAGHNIPPGLDEILTDMDERLGKLEGRKADPKADHPDKATAKPDDEFKSSFKPEPNPAPFKPDPKPVDAPALTGFLGGGPTIPPLPSADPPAASKPGSFPPGS